MYKSKERAVNSFFRGKINGTLRYVLLVCGEGDEAPALFIRISYACFWQLTNAVYSKGILEFLPCNLYLYMLWLISGDISTYIL
jgi:hypothetical protein